MTAILEVLLYDALTEGRRASSEPTDLPTMIRNVERILGGSRASAEQLGVTQRTWQRWRKGTNRPSARHMGAIKLAQRLVRLSPSRAQKYIRANSPTVWWINRYDGRDRVTDAKALEWAAGGVRSVIEAWRIGDDSGAALAFVEAIGNPFYRAAIEAGSGMFAPTDTDLDIDVDLVKIRFGYR